MPFRRQSYICIRTCAIKAIHVVVFTFWAIWRREWKRYFDKVDLKIFYSLSAKDKWVELSNQWRRESPLPSIVASIHDTSHPYHQQVTFLTKESIHFNRDFTYSIYFKPMLVVDYGVISWLDSFLIVKASTILLILLRINWVFSRPCLCLCCSESWSQEKASQLEDKDQKGTRKA